MLISRFILVFQVSTGTCLHALMFKNTLFSSYYLSEYTCIHRLVSVSESSTSVLSESLHRHCSRGMTVAALQRNFLPIYSIVVTSQPYRSLDCLFKGSVSEYKLCAFLCGFDSVTVFIQHLHLLYNKKKIWKFHFLHIWNL